MNAIDLFSGIGGFALAGKNVWGKDYKIKAFCEIDKFCQKVLRKNFGEDILIYDDIKKFDGTKFGRIDIITGGFPCQPFSVAGKRKGKEDDRALWPEMFRITKEAKPRYVIGENVAGFVGMGLDESISDLESEGYEVQAFIIPACAVNAPHRRDRVWIVANCESGKSGEQTKQERRKDISGTNSDARNAIIGGLKGQSRWRSRQELADGHLETEQRITWNAESDTGDQVEEIQSGTSSITGRGNSGFEQGTDTDSERGINGKLRNESQKKRTRLGHFVSGNDGGLRGKNASHTTVIEQRNTKQVQEAIENTVSRTDRSFWNESWLEVAARLCRVDDGVSDRVHRLKALGNAIVPQVVYEIMMAIKELDSTERKEV